MKALILCGGFGTRLKEVIHDRPKVMAPVGRRPFLAYVVENLRKNGIKELVISIGYLGDYIRDYFKNGEEFGLKINYSEERRPLGTGGAVKMSEKFFEEPFVVVNGDTYLDTNFQQIYDFHLKNKAKATIAVVRKKTEDETGQVVLGRESRVKDFAEGVSRGRTGYVNAGVYVFSPRATNIIKNKTRFSLEKDLFPRMVLSGDLRAFAIKDDFIDVGTRESYQEAQKKLADRVQRTIEVRVPVRVSFAGGGTDLPEYFLKHGGVVVGTAINKYAHVRLKTADSGKITIKLLDFGKKESYILGKNLPYDNSIFDLYKGVINKLHFDQACEIVVWGDFPAGSGLGSSSAIAAAVIYAILALTSKKLSKEHLSRETIELERVELNIPGGWQDQYLCVLGGINQIEFTKKGKVQVRPLKLPVKTLKKLEGNLILFYLGGKRREKVQQSELRSKIETSKVTLAAFEQLKNIAIQVRRKLEAGELDSFGKLLNEAWEQKRRSSGKISNVFIDKIYELARRNGALGGKLLGAGGGGYLLFYCSNKSRPGLIESMKKFKLIPEPFKFDMEGVQIVHED